MAIKEYSLSRALANISTGNAPEFEAHYALVKANESWRNQFGVGPVGMKRGMHSIEVPWSALRVKKNKKKQKRSLARDLTAGTAASGGFTVGTDVPMGVQASLRPSSLLMKLPITVLENCEGSVVLPRISSGVTPSSLNELSSFTSADPAFGAANAGPQRMSAAVTFSRQLLQQSVNSSIDRVLTQELCRAISFQIDSLLLTGTGVNSTPIGVLNQNATSQNTYVAAGGYAQLMSAQKQLEDGFIDSTNAIWLVSTNTAKVWRTTLKTGTTARYILDRDSRVNDILAYPTAFIPNSSDQTILADWSQLVLAIFGSGLEIIYDPFTKASSGEIVLTANVYWQGFIRRPSTFVVSTNAGSIFTS
jgi:HK97 family phage major capsid protein